MKRTLLQARPGQGMLEMLISISLMLVGIVAVMTLTVRLLQSSGDAAVRAAASGLAREMIEVARAERDAAWMQGRPMADSFRAGNDRTFSILRSPAGWTLSFAPNAITDEATRVWQDLNNGFSLQFASVPGDTAPSLYRRLGTSVPLCAATDSANPPAPAAGATCPPGTDEVGVEIVAQVDWSYSGRTHTLVVREELYDWR